MLLEKEGKEQEDTKETRQARQGYSFIYIGISTVNGRGTQGRLNGDKYGHHILRRIHCVQAGVK